MKHRKKNLSLVFLGLVLVLIFVVAVIMLLPKNGDNEIAQQEQTTAVLESTESTTSPTEVVIDKPIIREYDVVELVDGKIQTPYGSLNYPEGLAEYLLIINTAQQPYTLEFYAVMEEKQELRLFDISLGEGSGGNMGMVTTPEGEIPLNVVIYELTTDETWSESEIITAYAMQDVVNEMIDQMAPQTEEEQEEENIISQQPDEGATINNLEIETPYGTVYYPARWANTVRFDSDDSQEAVYKVNFYSRIDGLQEQLLFSIHFGGDEGEQIGAVMNGEGIPVPVSLFMGQLQIDGLNENEAELLLEMQEACNQLIERLPLLQ